MKRLSSLLFLLSLLPSISGAMPLHIGSELQHCLSLPAYGHNIDTQEKCKSALLKSSGDSLNHAVHLLHENIASNYDDPYRLNDSEGKKIKDIFWENFQESQQAWVISRDKLCTANAALVGEWAASRDDIKTQCILDQNRDRQQFIKMTWLK
ncbi:lysozyme inhibitor LprI family protein [Kosakonia cowanii]|uniref:lysozyme inhibitor LprI family protein n=1 Tax=Kosakonia cowanii TaxID=208223 RepID=UPI0022E43F2B|nr:lysozyme inhibitor LprI family protein [Kosakonia cowanii]